MTDDERAQWEAQVANLAAKVARLEQERDAEGS